ncbi:MAG: TIGR01777 family oxidoreductase [Bacteroidota bacterium]
MNVFITGGTGFIGKFLIYRLIKENAHITVATRQKFKHSSHIDYVNWNELTDDEKLDTISKSDVIINLAGENIASRRWSDKQKAKIIRSRTKITSSLVEIINRLSQNDKRVFISASAVGYYGDKKDEIISEASTIGNGFLAEVCELWEKEALKVRNCRLVIPRIGVVLHPSGGALKKMLLPYKYYIGGILGSGKQYVPWVHIDELVNMFLFVAKNKSCEGVYNFVAPNPCTMKEFALSIGSILNKPVLFKIPEFLLNIILGESATIITNSQRVIPQRLIDARFEFEFERIEPALNDLLKHNE